MELNEIVSGLVGATGRFERAALEAASDRREEIVPELLRILDDAVVNAGERASQPKYFGHIYAAYLLAQFREVRAYPALLRLTTIPEDTLKDLCGDFLTGGFPRTVASVCDGDLEPIVFVIANPKVSNWARGAMIDSLVALVANDLKTREEILQYFATLLHGGLERTPSHVWNALVAALPDLYPVDLIADIERAYDEGLVDPTFVGLREIRREIAAGPEVAMAWLRSNVHCRLVDSAINELQGWYCFEENRTIERKPSNSVPETFSYAVPTIVKGPKTGRNEPCPCGSGKKFKKCCG